MNLLVAYFVKTRYNNYNFEIYYYMMEEIE